jgi:hypothetical protein
MSVQRIFIFLSGSSGANPLPEAMRLQNNLF